MLLFLKLTIMEAYNQTVKCFENKNISVYGVFKAEYENM